MKSGRFGISMRTWPQRQDSCNIVIVYQQSRSFGRGRSMSTCIALPARAGQGAKRQFHREGNTAAEPLGEGFRSMHASAMIGLDIAGNYPYVAAEHPLLLWSPSRMTDILPDACSCGALRQATRHVTRLYDDALAPVGLGLNQYSILSKLVRFGPQNLQDLAALLVMDRSTLGHLLRPLENRALLTIGTAKDDRRQRVIALTDTGAALMQEAKPLWAQAERSFERSFGADAARALRAALQQVTAIEFLAASNRASPTGAGSPGGLNP
jgi:DNA-binding MarR family transcriptional regulator